MARRTAHRSTTRVVALTIALCATGSSTSIARALPPVPSVPAVPTVVASDPLLDPEPLALDHEVGDRYTPLAVALPTPADRCPGADLRHPSSWHLLLLGEQVEVSTLQLDLDALERHDVGAGVVRVVATVTGDPLADVGTDTVGRIDLAERVYLRPDAGLAPGRFRLALVCEQGGEPSYRWELALDLTRVSALTLEWQVAPPPVDPTTVAPTGPTAAVPTNGTTAEPPTETTAPPNDAAASSTTEPAAIGARTVPLDPTEPTEPTEPVATTLVPETTTSPAASPGDAASVAPDPAGGTNPEIALPALPPTEVSISDIPAPVEPTPTLPGTAQPFGAAVPTNALVVVQRCGVHGALPSEPADAGFPALAALAPRSTTASSTVETTAGATTDAEAGTTDGRCAARLGTASLLMSGPLAGQYYVAAGPIDRISVVDTRPLASGFSLSGSVGSFRSDRDRFDGRLVGLTPVVSVDGTAVAADAASATSVSTAGNAAFVASEAIAPGEGTGLATARMLAVAPAGRRVGTVNLDARLKVLVPVTAAAGIYTATFTITAI